MKTIIFLRKTTFLSLLVGLVLVQLSCSDDFIGAKLDKATVETLVEDFGANDGLSVDRGGNIYASNFAAFAGTELLKTNPRTGVTEIIADNLVAPTGNVVDSDGNIFVVNNIRFLSQEEGTTQADVLRISSDGTQELIATLPGFPAGITLDNANNIYVSNFSFAGVHKITLEGEVSVYAQDPRLLGGVGIDFDNSGNLLVGNFSTGDIISISEEGNSTLLATIPTVVEGVVLGYITYFAGSVFATAISENIIYRVTMDGEVISFAGNGAQATIDGNIDEASFSGPNGITADPLRNRIYISETGNSALRVIKFG